MHHQFKYILLFLCLILSLNCSKNPFSSTKMNSGDDLTLKGQVTLNDKASPDNVYVWLQGANLSAFTDENGKFTLELPPVETQPGEGLNGDFTLYFYVGNYELKTTQVAIINGKFAYDQGNIDKNGNLKTIINLKKLVDIKTSIDPPQIAMSDTIRLEVTVTLTPHAQGVKVASIKHQDGWLRAMIFKNVNDTTGENALFYGPTISPVTEILYTNEDWKLGLQSIALLNSLVPGEYEIIPYLNIIQNDVPDDLLKSLAEHAASFHPDYLKIPFKWNVGHFILKQ